MKRTPNGNISRYKSRLCAKGFSQIKGIDYVETFSPTTRYDTIRILLAIATTNDFEITQFDIKTAFLNGNLEEEIFMTPPEGTNIEPGVVCKLKKALYGLKQAPRCWYQTLNNFLTSLNLKQCEADKCVYKGEFDKYKVIIVIFVDDGLIMSKNIKKILQQLQNRFEVTVNETLNYFVGLEILRDRKNKTIFIHQTNYIQQIINRFKMTDATPANTPADVNTTLTYPDNNRRRMKFDTIGKQWEL